MDRWRAWLEARIAHGLGEFEAAERRYKAVRAAYQDARMPYNVALVALDLALLYTEAGACGEVRTLATEMLPVFHERAIHREALAALMLFHEAAQREAVTVEMVKGLSAYLRRIRRPGG